MFRSEYTYLSSNVDMLTLLGCYPLDDRKPPWLKTVYHVWRMILISALVVLAVCTSVDLLGERFDFTRDGFKVVHLGIYNVMAYFFCFYWGKETLVKIVVGINENFAYESRSGVETGRNMSRSIKIVKKMNVYWSTYCFVLATYIPFLKIVLSDERSLMVPTWYPYDWKKSPAYELTWLFQFITISIVASVYSQTDSFLVSTVYTIIEQFRILEYNFRNVMFTALFRYGFDGNVVVRFSSNNFKNQSLLDAMKTVEYENILREAFRECVEQHQMLLQLCRELRDFLSPIMFIKIQTTVFFIVIFTFTALTTSDMTLWLTMFGYISAVIGELLILSVSGQLLLSQAELVLKSIYGCPWYMCSSNKFKKDLFIAGMRSTVPITLSGAQVVEFSLETFVSVLKTAFSFYAVLRQLLIQEGN